MNDNYYCLYERNVLKVLKNEDDVITSQIEVNAQVINIEVKLRRKLFIHHQILVSSLSNIDKCLTSCYRKTTNRGHSSTVQTDLS